MNFNVNVPMTETLRSLLNPDLFRGETVFSGTLNPPNEGEKVYSLSQEEIQSIKNLRGSVVDLHPGMGGIAPEKLLDMINKGIELTSLDYMVTQGCNFNCTWCFANSGPKQKDYIPFSKLEAITQEAADLGVSLFVLTGGEPLVYRDRELGEQKSRGDHFFRVVKMIRDVSSEYGKDKKGKILTFDDVALITPEIAERFAEYEVGLCTKGDTLIPELQDFKVNQTGAFKKMQKGYENLISVGYGTNPKLRVVVNSVLDHSTFDGMLDLHMWVMEKGFDHSIVPVHYCGNAVDENQEMGIHSPHVKVLYDLISKVDEEYFGVKWTPRSAFTYNKTCNRNRSGLHIKANGDVTACSESPGKDLTERYTFGNIFQELFSLKDIVRSQRLRSYRKDFSQGHGVYVCSPKVCDLYANDLCQGGCATRSAYSKVDYETGLVTRNDNPNNYSDFREDPLCPAWTVLALKQGILKEGLLEGIHKRILEKTTRINSGDFLFEGGMVCQ